MVENNTSNRPSSRGDIVKTLQAYRDEIRGFGVKKISLFGSVARDSLGPKSDLDILVEFTKTTYRGFIAFKAFLESMLGRTVDMVTPPAVNGRFKKEIAKDIIDVET